MTRRRYCFARCADPWFNECADCWLSGGNPAIYGGSMEREYEVVGGNRVHGHEPGDTFTADLAPHEEALLVESGNVRRVKRAKLERAVDPAPVETATLDD